MTSRILLLLPLFLAGHLAYTQQVSDRVAVAEEQYHDAAQAYLNDDNDRAERTAESGLTADPDNQKLKDLLDLIRQQKQQNPSGGNGEDDEQDESDESDEESPSESGQQDDSSEQQNNDNQQRNTDSDQNPQDSPPEEQGQPGGNAASSSSETQPQSGRMSRAEAARLLDAIGAEERLLLERIRRSPQRNPEKDW